MTTAQIKIWKDIIRTPCVSSGELEGISSRVLNYWETQGVGSCSRHSSSGWRKFSIADMLFLYISLELRTVGMDLITIAKIRKVIARRGYLESCFLRVMEFDHNIFLWVGKEGIPMILSNTEIPQMLDVTGKLSRAKILLPLSEWIRKLVEAAK